MADTVSSKRRSEIMSNIKSKGMMPEMMVRRLVHSMGYRYRLHRMDLPGKPDLVFPRLQKVIFVHGCFWHQHPSTTCKNSRTPRSNLNYWATKLKSNVTRDAEQVAKLYELGWKVMILWECEVKTGTDVGERIREFLECR